MLFQRYKKRKQFITYRLGECYQDIWEQPKTHNTPTPTMLYNASFDTMLSKLETATKAVGRYHIGMNMKYGGHVITAERLADGRMVLYYDVQSGTFLKIEEYPARDVEYFEVIKWVNYFFAVIYSSLWQRFCSLFSRVLTNLK
ncbi:MAG: toxin glutamine deamidase domain-containing protein [Candidatus Cryptobacteroides sp.]